MGNRPFKKKLRKHDLETNNSYLGDLPNEILWKILDYLHIRDLLRCGQTCRRLRFVVHDRFLWKKVNLSNKSIVPVKLLKWILERGCEYLNISNEINGHLMLNQTTKLKCLNFAWKIHHITKFCVKADVLLTLLRSCTVLEKLELYCVNFASNRTLSIQGVKTLRILRLSYCKSTYKQTHRLELDFIKQIIDQCLELEELSFYKTHLSEDAIDYLVKNITPKLSKLSLYTMVLYTYLSDATVCFDKYIQVLANRCTNLTELSLSGSGFTDDSVNYIVENLHSTLEKLSLIGTSIWITKLFELKAMKKLNVLDFYSSVKVKTEELERFRKCYSHIQLFYDKSNFAKPNWNSDNLSAFRSYK